MLYGQIAYKKTMTTMIPIKAKHHNRKAGILLSILFAVFCLTGNGYAQSSSATAGKEFYITFFKNRFAPSGTTPTLQIKVIVSKPTYITARYNYTGMYWNNWNRTLVQPGIYTARVNYDDVVNSSSGKTTKCIILTSSEDVSVYGINYLPQSADAAVILPVPAWGREYYVVSGGHPSPASVTLYAVIARENRTTVTLHNQSTVILNAGEVFQYAFTTPIDGSGNRVIADKPVAFFSGTDGAYGPGQPGGYCNNSGFSGTADHTYEQLWSRDKWGQEFFVWNVHTPSAAPKNRWGGIAGMVAAENNTHVRVEGSINGGIPITYTLAAGQNQFVCHAMSGLVRIVSDKPVMVYNVLPDAALTCIPPIAQRVNSAILSPFVPTGASNITQHSVELLIPSTYWEQTVITENDMEVSRSTYAVTASAHFPEWYIVRKLLSNRDIKIGVHCPGGLLAFMYGAGMAEAYGYVAGAGSFSLWNYFTIRDANNIQDAHYASTTPESHTFSLTDSLTIKRTLQAPFTAVKWLVNGVEYVGAIESPTVQHTLKIPASLLSNGINDITMSVRFAGATADVLYTGHVWAKVDYRMHPDFATVQMYHPVIIDMLANDHLPDNAFASAFNLLSSVREMPRNGTLTAIGAGRDSKLIYTNSGTDSLTGNIDSFRYEIPFGNNLTPTALSAWVYIYVLQDLNDATTCTGDSHQVALRENPPNVAFEWYDKSGIVPLGVGAVRDLPAVTTDADFRIRPVLQPDRFPQGAFTVYVANPVGQTVMQWTGVENTDWRNPNNWVSVVNDGHLTYETPVQWAPTACVDVVLPSGMMHYPELSDAVACRDILMKDRAMLKNPHALSYRNAKVEIQLHADERDRFLMWSVPLKSMYSGDYHYKNYSLWQWGDINMNFFQAAHPSNGIEQGNTFTATFGGLNVPLPLGLAFNIKVTTTIENKDKPFLLPDTATFYKGKDNQIYPTPRTDGARFITDGIMLAADGTFDLPVQNDVNRTNMVQVVNPYFAWLDVAQFLEGNRDILDRAGYVVWNGIIDSSFIGVFTNGNRYVATHLGDESVASGWVAPLHSFFVKKKNNTKITNLKMSPFWTTTSTAHPRPLLRMENESEIGILRIRATQGNSVGYAILRNDMEATPHFEESKDVCCVFYDKIPLTVYTLCPQKKPLFINSCSDYTGETTLGLLIRKPGAVTLNFSGMSTFGYDATLIDKKKNIVIDLQQTPTYTFTPTGRGRQTILLNDRFTLRFKPKGDVGMEDITTSPTLQLTSHDGNLYVHSVGNPIRLLQVYNIVGQIVYATKNAANTYCIPVPRGQIYLVTAQIDRHTISAKIMVSK